MKKISEGATIKIINGIKSYMEKFGKMPWQNPLIMNNMVNDNVVNTYTTYGANGKPYHGGNAFLTSMIRAVEGKSCRVFMTFNNLKDIGAYPSAGSKSVPVFFWNIYFVGEDGKYIKTEAEANKRKEDGEKIGKAFCLKQWDVFNLEDCTFPAGGKFDSWQDAEKKILKLKEENKEETESISHNEKILSCEEIINNYSTKCRIEEVRFMKDSSAGCYHPLADYITIPKIAYFKNSVGYYSTLFHELVHSTGHQDRLKRDIVNKFGTTKYAKEEMIAEFGSMLLLSQTTEAENIEAMQNSTAYLENWSERIKDTDNFIDCLFKALTPAKRAVEYILNNGQLEEV